MKTFSCGVCAQPVYFENSLCTNCGSTLGFLPDQMRLAAVVEGEDGLWHTPRSASEVSTHPAPQNRGFWARLFGRDNKKKPVERMVSTSPTPAYRKCGNYLQHNVCNWMAPAESTEVFCTACQPNQIIPNLSRPGNLEKWARIERSKRRLVYGLLRLGLPQRTKAEDAENGLGFAFLSSLDAPPDLPVLTGHADGLITINLDEADSVHRERMRLDMDEKYRTLLGHFRHEIGHYYWDLLVRDSDRVEAFRELFGDERADYQQALDNYYANGAPEDWQDRCISAYAASHPWEDWAESFAHYLHIVDTLETSEHFGITTERRLPDGAVQGAAPDFDSYGVADFGPIIDQWAPLTFALNSINRSMGQTDTYPFVLSPKSIEKLGFVHQVIRDNRL
ncbi:MAG: putative zinc-binding peptidase [Gammaproteobacteria bacterium]|nr:putative zinc-binding peptidase [Gammaproteobacteria bacterium]MCP5458679.1 putative zinc-binding peptidase [Gammaproteobacteria bacterium]